MNFDDYETTYAARYAEFADAVRFILESAIAGEKSKPLPVPQSIQSRAKTAESLKRKLAKAEIENTKTVERDIRDLAGVRLIFYTNTDVDRFAASRLIRENFEVDRGDVKIHHPTEENNGTKYRAIHFTVRLNEARARLPEYQKFAGMRCEIQIQTILNHSWSETSHDIIYKGDQTPGFGTKALESITKRLHDIMDNYLLPAGLEFARVQQDYERLKQGKALFDQDALRQLEAAKDNNDRWEILRSLKEYALPYYDDVAPIYQTICDALMAASRAAKQTPDEPLETTYGRLEGHSYRDVAIMVVDVLEDLRNAGIEITFSTLINLFREESDSEVRARIIDAAKNLSRYDLSAWRQVGPAIQLSIMDEIESLDEGDLDVLRPLIVTVLSNFLMPELRGMSMSGATMTLRVGAVPISDYLVDLRRRAIMTLFALFVRASTAKEQRDIISALHQATTVPNGSGYTNALLNQALLDSAQIVDFLANQIDSFPWELRAHVEQILVGDFRRAQQIATGDEAFLDCRPAALGLIAALEGFRDRANQDEAFVKFKTLVGFESVFAGDWASDEVDFGRTEAHRQNQVAIYVAKISPENEDVWASFIRRCASSDSNDGAYFTVFSEFLRRLAEAHPNFAVRVIDEDNDAVLRFLSPLLSGLSTSGSEGLYTAALNRAIEDGRHLSSVVRQLRYAGDFRLDQVANVLAGAVAVGDASAVIEILAFAIQGGALEDGVILQIFLPGLRFLTSRGETHWTSETWFLRELESFFAALDDAQAAEVFENLTNLRRIDHTSERVIAHLARNHARRAWEFLVKRVRKKRDGDDDRFEPYPGRLFELAGVLGLKPVVAVEEVKKMFFPSDPLFAFDGGRLLCLAFPACPEPFSSLLVRLIADGGEPEIKFALAVVGNYDGQPFTHDVFKAIVDKIQDGSREMPLVEIALRKVGVVSGRLGFVRAYRARKDEMAAWTADARPKVRNFAERFIESLEQSIAAEQRSAEQDVDLLEFETEEQDDNDDDADPYGDGADPS